MSLKNKRNIFRGINLFSIFGVIAVIIAPIIYLLVPNDTEEDFRSSIQSFPAISYVQSLVGLKESEGDNHKYFLRAASVHGFWFSMPQNWEYTSTQDNVFKGDEMASYIDHMWSDYDPDSHIWFYSDLFLEKSITGPNKVDELCRDDEKSRSEKYNIDFKFDECRIADNIKIGYNHRYYSHAAVNVPDRHIFQYSFFLENRLVMMTAGCFHKESLECKAVQKILDIIASNLCVGLECATVKTKASDDDMKIINAALNAKTKSREAEPHRIFGGIGVELKKYDNLLEIVDFSNDSPARKTGIQTGDIILEINNISLEDISFDEAIQLLRGDSGTAVAITIKRNESIKPLLFNVKREIINFDTKDYKTVLDSTESFSFRIPENCIIETHNSNILDNSTANKLDNSQNILSTGESVNELSSELQKTQTGVIDSMACKGMAGLWNINSSAPREKVKINEYTYKNVCGVFGELLSNVHGTGKVTIKDCKLADNILLGTDHLHVSFIVKDQYTRFTYIFNYKGKQFTLFGQCNNQYSNECNKISYMTDDLASSLSEKGL